VLRRSIFFLKGPIAYCLLPITCAPCTGASGGGLKEPPCLAPRLAPELLPPSGRAGEPRRPPARCNCVGSSLTTPSVAVEVFAALLPGP
jgi:hypothetical protein